MKILITGICGFVGSNVARWFRENVSGTEIFGLDNLARAAFGLPVWINRCGVLAGAGQFGTAEQGIFSYWLHAWKAGRRLRCLGFGGRGLQVRDAFHPRDLAQLISRQLADADPTGTERLWNVGGGLQNSMSLAELSAWAQVRFGHQAVETDSSERAFDVPWVIVDSQKARERWRWSPSRSLKKF